jgi:two-component system, NtrC family, sensor kinase
VLADFIGEVHSGTVPLVSDHSKWQEIIRYMVSASDDLIGSINSDLERRVRISHKDRRASRTFVVWVAVAGVLLMAALLRSFYFWVFNPVREMQKWAGRVAQGDFEHRIEVHSRDEFEDLATAANETTTRLSDLYGDLERQVNERSRQLVRSERLASLGFLAAGVAHEINNPLASIAFCAEALERRIAELLGRPPAEGETVSKYLKMIQHEAFRCKEITQRLLQFSRGGDRREPTELGELVQSVLEIAQHLEACQGKRIVFQPAARLTAVVNGQEVTQVILNLVVNALESMGEGGTLLIALGQRGGSAELVFSDTGCGMTAEVLENIFEPFYTTKASGRGTGLGLSISHLIITQHGGEISAASPGPNQGSTFTVRLPLQPGEAPDADPTLPLRSLTGPEGVAWAGAAAA